MSNVDFTQLEGSIYPKEVGGIDITTIDFSKQPEHTFAAYSNDDGTVTGIDWDPAWDTEGANASVVETSQPDPSNESNDEPSPVAVFDIRPVPGETDRKKIVSMSYLSPLNQIRAIDKVKNSATPLEKARLADARAALQDQRKDLHREIRDLLEDSDPAEGERCLGQGTHIGRHVNGEWHRDPRRPSDEDQDILFRLIHAIVQAEVPDVRLALSRSKAGDQGGQSVFSSILLLGSHAPLSPNRYFDFLATDEASSIFDNATPDSFNVYWSDAALRIDFVPEGADGSSSVATWPPTKIDDDDTKPQSLWALTLGYDIKSDDTEQLGLIISEFEDPKVQLEVVKKASRKVGLDEKVARRLDVADKALSKDIVKRNPRITRY
ncbi:hypothetical protein FFLO_05869 [Filobasidium floriforme]|uniref:Uncharacterized protein n=1 Tax=Filobasidium floriforme TaxID=5210 RepID=A0A8K0JLM2_9TREE|nr:uncharacterized protein HD553DRAFT_336273 [Filobasidium floriforme]KAG7528970.1 hypothetical protein FFLO_05869 [Filobasidium floriforme]KAH8081746.1 hypothetical protein HD553DRAFT_336273 [Filobasidium floriforme]